MSRWATGAVLGAALGSMGCLLPRVLTTPVEVITAADSKAAFGPKAELRALDETMVLAWDAKLASYTGRGDAPRALRVARLKGEVYLFQAELELADEGYTLVLARVSRDGDVMPLSCDIPPASAADYGVLTTDSHGLGVALRGDRAGIIGLLASVLPTCRPLTRVDHWLPPTVELAAAAAAAGASGTAGCLSCPAGACVQGTVADQTGAILPNALVSVTPRSGSGSARTARSDEAGRFLVTGLAAGSYVVSVEMAGFARLVTQPPFTATPSVNYLFESTFVLRVVATDESITVSEQPTACRKALPRTKH